MEDQDQFEDLLLRSARNGDYRTLEEVLLAKKEGKASFDINCKGQSKMNLGWTPLHLAAYFGHRYCVELLLKYGAVIDCLNDMGDTALHKAALTNRENKANVFITNGEGLKSSDMPSNPQILDLIVAAEKTEKRHREERLLQAARVGNVEKIKLLLKELPPLNINCTDGQGNTCLHIAAYRSHIDVAVTLLQNGCDTSIKNNSGQYAVDLVKSAQMKQVLEVQPVRSFHRSVTRFEGPVLRRMRLLGWRMVWAVLERGVITFYKNRADGSSGAHRNDFKYLDGAKVTPSVGGDNAIFLIEYNDGTSHRLAAVPAASYTAIINQQKWVKAFEEHIKFSTYYIQKGLFIDDEVDEDCSVQPLGSMQDVLHTASAHQTLLEQQIQEVMAFISTLSADEKIKYASHDVLRKFVTLSSTARNMASSLGHGLTLMKQQEEARELKLQEEQEKVRVLEESLRVLAAENNELEVSLAEQISSSTSHSEFSHYNTPANSHISLPRPRRYYIDSAADDVFYDAFSRGSINMSV